MKKEKKTEEEKKAEKRIGEEKKVEEKMEEAIEKKAEELEEEKKVESEESEEIKGKETAKEEEKQEKQEKKEEKIEWIPKTRLGREVKEGKVKSIEEIFEKNLRILEPEIVDFLLPELQFELINIGQAKGKSGGGRRTPKRQTQKMTAEGKVPSFTCMAVVGNCDGYVGLGCGKAKEVVPAKQKAIRRAKLNIMPVKRGCGSFECTCKEKHSIPFKVEGKCGSARIILIPAPKGTGLVVDSEIKKILRLAGIKDVYSKTFGQTRTKLNLAKATIEALKALAE